MTIRGWLVLLACALTLAGCGRVSESRFNPFNWFGSNEVTETEETAPVPDDPRILVPQVTNLVIEETPTGAIIRATGLPPSQGWYDADLIAASDGPLDGVMTYRFVASPPPDVTAASTARSRELVVGTTISPQMLAQTRSIRVIAAQNIRTISR